MEVDYYQVLMVIVIVKIIAAIPQTTKLMSASRAIREYAQAR